MQKTFGQIIAEILNAFFSSRLTGWDVDFCIGRNCLKCVTIHHKTIIAELWHNPLSSYEYIVNSLYDSIAAQKGITGRASEWFKIAVRIAVLFGIYGEMCKQQFICENESLDIAVPVTDLSAPIAAYYARYMGLPLQKIICADRDNSGIWDLIQRGMLNPASVDDHVLTGVERLIQATLGFDSAQLFRMKCQKKQVYNVSDQQEQISSAFFCSVIGNDRVPSVINSIFRSNSYIVDPDVALCHGSLQDYRAKTGNSRTTLIFAEKSPIVSAERISSAIGVDANKLTDHLNLF
jgi:threonine synthase